MVTLSGLPAGNYIAWVTAENSNFGGHNNVDANCSFETGGGQLLDPVGASFSVPPYGSDYPPANITGAVTFTSVGSLKLACNTTYDDSGKRYIYGTITAIKVDQLD